ncbi:PP2C family protein-serine/threonine phosphatase [Plantactinospora siamensis]|uniref:PP2C family protein-serine/threonine phosphatase n=1 Tax=Plantactinospora siamensis TaxID=555372 RepID=A0ABV6NWV8_9ACTN
MGRDRRWRGVGGRHRGLGRDAVTAVVREVVSGLPAGCTWLLPESGPDGRPRDYLVAAVSDRGEDLYGRGAERTGQRLSELYPGMVGGPLWALYATVLDTGTPGELADFQYTERRSGVVERSSFEVRVHPMLGGLLVWWQRVDEARRRLDRTELLGSLGWAEYDLLTGNSEWSPGMFRIFDRDPALGPMPRAEQSAAILPADRGLSETAWQTLDTGAASDVTVRFRLGGSVKHLRILSDVARDADGEPLKVYAVVQDVTAREDSRSAIERLSDQLRSREMTALAEHRLAGQLQHLIQPLPPGPFPLPGLEAMVSYLPAESAMQVGGDWYHADALPDGSVALAVGDVAGHGLDAANGMAHLRFALSAWLSIGITDPGILLAHLNRLSLQLAITGTAVLARYEPVSRTLSWARAGHPAPLVARAGVVEELPGPRRLLLGADADAAYPVVDRGLLAEDLVLLYTDGLVEHRTGGVEPMLQRVREVMAAASAEPGPRTLGRLRTILRYANPDDDTCLLALRVAPPPDGAG